ncbi:MAG: hypothetical protein VZR02_07275 [Lachnospiraceae bacterium]|nr:hypothetical protein [Lachnospiraceae bacterium]
MGKPASFIIDVEDNQNHTWQGKITWVQAGRTVPFRSALELMDLMDSVVQANPDADQVLSSASGREVFKKEERA